MGQCWAGFPAQHWEVFLAADGDAYLQAPKADLVIVHAVDGAIFPDGGGGGEGAEVVLELDELLAFAEVAVG